MLHFLYNLFLVRKNVKKENGPQKWCYWYLYKFLKRALPFYYRNLSSRNLKTDSTSNIIVSLTSFPDRIPMVFIAIKSIMLQTYKPQKVVLWLGSNKFPNKERDLPESLLQLRKVGLEIFFVDDLKPHTKYYYAFKKYPNNLVVTIDDDWIYPISMLETVLIHHLKNPNCVIANRVREIGVSNGILTNYRSWDINKLNHSEPSTKLLATGVGGVLYQPFLFDEALYDITKIKRMALNADDIWLKANEMISHIPVVFTNRYFSSFIEIPNSQSNSLYMSNVFEAQNDMQIANTFSFFGITAKSFNS
ncbi:hypothetical protein [uncultured Gelidibacter sp.]|uniref:hypothetical protein n=1 Tax=uncultured Gelidibacter sp. TaxID=259318 RepID=UPI00262022D4|nr:hypothetical protein [uncultured Gelidibacter sp.]